MKLKGKKMQVIYLRTVIKLFRLLKIFFSLYFQCGTWCYRQASVTWLAVATYSSQRRKLAQICCVLKAACSPQSSREYCFAPSLLCSLSSKEAVVFVTSVLCIGSVLKTVQAVSPELPQRRGEVHFLGPSLNGSTAAPALLAELRVLAGAAKSSLGKENQGQTSGKVAVASSKQNQ